MRIQSLVVNGCGTGLAAQGSGVKTLFSAIAFAALSEPSSGFLKSICSRAKKHILLTEVSPTEFLEMFSSEQVNLNLLRTASELPRAVQPANWKTVDLHGAQNQRFPYDRS